jgi:cell division protein FtsZ
LGYHNESAENKALKCYQHKITGSKNMTLTLRIPEQNDLSPRITVFGIGGAGGNAVNNMIVKNLEGADFVVANTDAQALQQSTASRKVQLGTKITEGLGAGAKPELGTKAAEESIEQIIDILEGSHLCFITAGMGGGTGTGAAPVVAQAARQLGVLTVGVVTKPFQFEGAKRMRQAELGIEELQKVVDTLIIIPNQNLFRLATEKTTFTEAFSMADDVLYQGVKGVTDLMVRPGLINLDFADVRSVMDEMGKAMMGTGEASGEDRAIQAAEKAIANPLLDEISLNGARGVLINITGGNDLTLFELDEAANRVRDEVDPEANIIVGSTMDPAMEGSIRVSVVATGIDVSNFQSDLRQTGRGIKGKDQEESSNQINVNNHNNIDYSGKIKGLRSGYLNQDSAENIEVPNQKLSDRGDRFTDIRSKPSNSENNTLKYEASPVSETARERLLAAVQKTPEPGHYHRPSLGLGTEVPKSSGGAFNNLLQRMTGNRERKNDEKFPFTKKETPNSHISDGKLETTNSEIPIGDVDRLEVPAFLRRQAN